MTLQNFTLGTFSQGAAGGGAAFESIASTTLGANATTVTFSAIPSTYQHLQIRCNSRTTPAGAQDILRFNGVSTNTYDRHDLYGNGSTVTASGNASSTYILCSTGGQDGTQPHVMIVDIHDYNSTTKNKTVRIFAGIDKNGSGHVSLLSGLWRSTSAITSLSLSVASDNYLTGSTFALYGIKGA